MAYYPNAIWKPVGNFGYPRGTHGQLKPVAIVDHIAQGTMAGMDAWFANPTSEASAHFAVGKLGQVHQYVDLKDAAWANGKQDRPDNTIPWMTVANPNLVTISIEHEGYTGEPWPEAMYQADLVLHRWLVGAFGIPIDDNHIIGHYRIDSVNRVRCPGTGWPKARLFQDLEEDDMTPEMKAEVRKIIHEELRTFAGSTSPGSLVRYLRDPARYPYLALAVSEAAARSGGLTVKQVKAIIRATKLSP